MPIDVEGEAVGENTSNTPTDLKGEAVEIDTSNLPYKFVPVQMSAKSSDSVLSMAYCHTKAMEVMEAMERNAGQEDDEAGQSAKVVAKKSCPNSVTLHQQRLDFGQSPTIRDCRVCGLVYDRAIKQEVKDHVSHHDDFLLGPKIKPDNNAIKLFSEIDEDGEEIWCIVVDYMHPEFSKNFAAEVLQLADKDLGSTLVTDKVLWSQIPDSASDSQLGISSLSAGVDPNVVEAVNHTTCGRFKVFLYIKKGRAIGCLLAERIRSGKETILQQVVEDEHGPWPEIVPYEVIVTISEKHDALMGVNKIWVHKNHRDNGVATRLLDIARQHFYGPLVRPLGKHEIAWTELTSLGSGLVKNYNGPDFEEEHGYLWLTYDDGM